MKFKIRPNLLPKKFKIIEKYMEEYSSSEYSSSEYSSEDSSYTSSEYSSESSDEDSNSSYDCEEEECESQTSSEKNFGIFLKEFSKTRNYKIKNDTLMIDYNFDSDRVGGKWKRHKDKSVSIYTYFLNTDKKSLKKGEPMYICQDF